jgi:hypothetical protein
MTGNAKENLDEDRCFHAADHRCRHLRSNASIAHVVVLCGEDRIRSQELIC